MNMNLSRRTLMALAAAMAGTRTWAQAVAGRPIRLVVPYPPGGGTDTLARHIAKGMETRLGVTVLVENKGGANGFIAGSMVARADPDGTTLLVVDNAITVNPELFKTFTLKPERDFAAVSLMGTAPLVLVVNPEVPVKNVKDLVAYAKANPKKLTYGSAGTGNTTHLCPEMFKLATQTDIQQIPYKGSGPAIVDLVGGQVSMMFTGISAVKQFVESGKLRALAVTGRSRSQAMPEVPTLAEAGVAIPELDQGTWWGIVGPAGLPMKDALNLAMAIESAGQDPETKARLNAMSITPVANKPDEFSRWISSEVIKYADLVKRAHIEVN